ncbi:MAG TPA: hypothetical protein DCS73_09865 [Roseburia sp.]|nr:hypothetical protein [Roseburia sp.]
MYPLFFVLKNGGNGHLLSGTIDFILQCAIYCLPDVIIKYVRCKKNPMAAWDFLYGRKILCSCKRQML